jgi:hypothetical protein
VLFGSFVEWRWNRDGFHRLIADDDLDLLAGLGTFGGKVAQSDVLV